MPPGERSSRRQSGLSRYDVENAVSGAFHAGNPKKWDVIEAAIRGRASPDVLLALVAIPDRTYATVSDVLSCIDVGT